MSRFEYTEESLRVEALNRAQEWHEHRGPRTGDEQVLQTAEKFLAFLRGDEQDRRGQS